MASATSFEGTEAFNKLCCRSKEELAQRVLIQRDMLRELLSAVQHQEVAPDPSEREYRIQTLEEELSEAKETIRRLVEGSSVEWEVP